MNDLGAEGANVILPDEIPALNITVNFANEYGRMSRMAIYGVKIINEGQVMSINDLYTENTYQFVALGLEPLNTNINSNTEESGLGEGDVNININHLQKNGDVLIVDASNTLEALLEDKNFNKNSGANIATQMQNNVKLNKDTDINDYKYIQYYSNIELTVRVEQPKENDELGLAVFQLIPNQSSGVINIYETINIEESKYQIEVDNRASFSISLPIGLYVAQYTNENAESSNTVNFEIEEYKRESININLVKKSTLATHTEKILFDYEDKLKLVDSKTKKTVSLTKEIKDDRA